MVAVGKISCDVYGRQQQFSQFSVMFGGLNSHSLIGHPNTARIRQVASHSDREND